MDKLRGWVSDMDKILRRGIITTPAFALNKKVMCVGRIPEVDDIRALLRGETDE